ncbi:peroxiredoxin-like family protein [Candidatus Thiosymbion oneisti]|uniref:peroxiredoxin-like family protein n=1 Tax=Candidatus Thiosymbion oneisti TaxID=589554 RepID=UPI00105D00CC|nr:peroxiredoxin-like family protein [Candidatus Thiosymbion oneisti]
MYHNRFVLAVLVLSVLFPVAALSGTSEPVPSYQEALDAFNAEHAKSDAPPLGAEDRRIMEDAAQELAVRMPEPGLKVGDKAPDFSLPNAFGRQVRLADLLGQGAVVLTFYRGAWCPYCNLQLHALHRTLPHIEQQGARLVAVTPQLPDKSREQVAKDGYPFEILSDLDDQVMKQYRLYFEVPSELSDLYQRRFSLDLADYNGAGRYVLPVPATFVIDRDGVVRAAFADVDYRKRMEPAAILAALKGLGTR